MAKKSEKTEKVAKSGKIEKSQHGASTTVAVPSPFRAFQEEMDRMFHAFSMPQMSWTSGLETTGGSLGLRVDIGETENEIQVQADLPGIPEEDVDVTLEDDVLTIRAEKKSEREKTEKNWRVVERSQGRFERSIRVPSGIDPDRTKAQFDKGVLTITLPKPPVVKSQSRRIEVKRAG